MKNSSLFLGTLLAMAVLSACNREESYTLKFENTLAEDRPGEIVEMEYKTLANLTTDFPEGKLPLFLAGTDTLVSQFMDFNKDGIPEEILVQTHLLSSEIQILTLKFVDQESYPEFPPRTNIRFASHENYREDIENAPRVQSTLTEITSGVYQMEGPGWENDKVGFRNYFDLRNGMDIFGKRTADMVLDGVGVKEKTEKKGETYTEENYHSLNKWGMDVLKVGNSLGAGAIAILWKDSLYRVGDNGNGEYDFLYEGPLRSEFRFRFPDWKAGDEVFDLTHYVSISAGEYAYRSSVYLTAKEEDVKLVSGIVNKHSDELYTEQAGNSMILLTHDIQSENGAMLGMGLAVPLEFYVSADSTANNGDGITETYYAAMDLERDEETKFWFYAFWETTDPAFGDREKVLEVIRKDIRRRENPVIISR